MYINARPKRLLFQLLLMCILCMQYSCMFDNGAGKEVPPDVIANKRLQRLANAFSEYVKANRSLPRPVYAGTDGIKCSWRFSILKYVTSCDDGVQSSLKDYVQGEEWDSSKNREWTMLHQFFLVKLFYTSGETICEGDSDYPCTSFVMLVHDRPLDDLPEDAVIVVESLSCGIHCLEPKDLDFGKLADSNCPFGKGLLNSNYNSVRAMTKGLRIIDIPKTLPKESVLKLLEGSQNGRGG
jgi:hypothetical protein